MWGVSSLSVAGKSVGLVMLNYNNASESVRFLENVSRVESLDAIQVVDNASTDGSDCEIEKCCNMLGDSRILLARSSANGGYGKGNNLGFAELAERGSCDFLLIANPDTYFDDGAVRAMAAFLDGNSGYAAVAPLMANVKGEICQSGWKLPDRAIMLKNALRLYIPTLSDPCDYGFDYDFLSGHADVDVLPGSLFMIRSNVFERVGGFDEDTFLYGEENLLFSKVRGAGLKCAILPECRYVHAHGTSIKKEFSSVRKRYRMLLESNLIYAEKALGASKAFLAFYSRLYRAGSAVFALLLTAKGALSPKTKTNMEAEG